MRRRYRSIERFGMAATLAVLVAAVPVAQRATPAADALPVAPDRGVPRSCFSPPPQADADCPAAWISPAELASRYSEHDVLIIDFRDLASYRRAHLPGAVSVATDGLPTLATVLRASDVQVVVYDDGASREAPMEVVAALRRLGLASVQALEGGLGGWVADGRVVVTQPSAGLD